MLDFFNAGVDVVVASEYWSPIGGAPRRVRDVALHHMPVSGI